MPVFVVGVDGGTSKTIALVADTHGRILGAGRAGGSNCVGPDVAGSMSVVAATIRDALAQAGLADDDAEIGVCCLAGADWPEDYERRQEALERSGVARRVIVKNDAMAGWRAGTRQQYGVVVVAGTGSNTCIITPDGKEWCFGYHVRYGGACDVGQDAIDAVLREADGRGTPTVLTATVANRLGYDRTRDLLMATYTGQLDRDRVLSLCPLVFEATDAGDEVAAGIIVKQGLALAEYATAAIRRYGMEGLTFDVVVAGSVFKGKGSLLTDTVTQAVHDVAPRARVVAAKFEPAVGAVLLAYDALGLTVSDEMVENLAQTVPEPEFFNTTGP